MARRDQTSLGGTPRGFQTTSWSIIEKLGSPQPENQQELINEFIRKYWKPVYCYLRRKGYANEQAKDLTQGYFVEIVLGRRLIERADQNRGRFRVLLLTALERYLKDVHAKETARMRRPEGEKMGFEMVEEEVSGVLNMQLELSPSQMFTYSWALEILHAVLGQVRQECERENKEREWDLFNDKVVQPILTQSKPLSLKELCQKHNIADPARASQIIFQMKQRFQKNMRRYLRQFVDTDSEVGDEFNDIFQILSLGKG